MVRKLATALVAPLLVLAACGDDGDGRVALTTEDAVAALAAAPDAAAAAQSFRIEMTVAFEAGGESFEVVASGERADERTHLEVDLRSLLAGQMPGGSVPAGMDGPMEVIVDGRTIYLRMPLLSGLTGTDGWLSASPEDLGSAGGLFDLGIGSGASDPSQMVEWLRGVSNDVEVVGQEAVRGVETTHLAVTIDLQRALDEMPADARASLDQEIADLGLSELPADIWLDGDDLVRRMVLDLGEVASGTSVGTMTMELFDYGADFDVSVPDPGDVTPFADAMGRLGSAGGQA